ncbi:MAG: hypothetical protein ACYSU0_18630 [Planctomycetota bacterium]
MADKTSKARGAALDKLHSYKAHLEAEISALQEKLQSVSFAIQSLTDERVPSPGEIVAAQGSKYALMPAQLAVERFLREHPETAFKAGELAKNLTRAGFVATAKNFPSQVAVALRRLEEKGVAQKLKKEGVLLYRLKDR